MKKYGKGVHLVEEDIKTIIENAPNMTREGLAEMIGCTGQTIWSYCRKLGVKYKPKKRTNLWSERELKILANTYGKMPTVELAKIMGRTEASIKNQVSKLRKSGVEVVRLKK